MRTLAIQPEYLKTLGQEGFINYSEWSIPLGRRFRALKIWFLLRSYGLNELRNRIRNHIKWANDIADQLRATSGFEIVNEQMLSLFTFSFLPKSSGDLDDVYQSFVDRIKDDGRIYLTQTNIDGAKVIRFQVGQFDTMQDDVQTAYQVICDTAQQFES